MSDAEIAELDAAIASMQSAIRIGRSDVCQVDRATTGEVHRDRTSERICGRSEQIRRDCELHPVDLGGFGLKIGGRWLVDEGRYRAMHGRPR